MQPYVSDWYSNQSHRIPISQPIMVMEWSMDYDLSWDVCKMIAEKERGKQQRNPDTLQTLKNVFIAFLQKKWMNECQCPDPFILLHFMYACLLYDMHSGRP